MLWECSPFRLAKFDTVPSLGRVRNHLGQGHSPMLVFHVTQQPARREQGHEPMHVCVLVEQRPVEPGRLIVVAVGVVVSALRPPHLVAHQQHRYAESEHGGGQAVLHLSVAQFLHRRVVGRTLGPAVPAPIVVRPVTVALAVQLIVFALVRNQVIEGEPVMTGRKVLLPR